MKCFKLTFYFFHLTKKKLGQFQEMRIILLYSNILGKSLFFKLFMNVYLQHIFSHKSSPG